MRGGAFLVAASFLLFMFATAAKADTTEGWYYAGDTFTLNGELYSVEGGFTYDKVLLNAGPHSYVISLNDCVNLPNARYCYLDTAYPSDESHIKYQGGKVFYGFDLSLTIVTPKVEVTRSLGSSTPHVNDEVQMNITLKNTGDVTVQDIKYVEQLPDGLVYLDGPGFEGGQVKYSSKSLASTAYFQYNVRPEDYLDADLQATISYTYNGETYNTTIAPLHMKALAPIEVTRYITPSINLEDTGVYSLNVSNQDIDETEKIRITVTVPEDLHEKDVVGLLQTGRVFAADVTLEPEENASVSLRFLGRVSGTFKLPVSITSTVHGRPFSRQYNETVTASVDNLAPTLNISNPRGVLRPGEPFTIIAALQNTNAVTTFKTISGTLSAPGLFEEMSFAQGEFYPKTSTTELTKVLTLPAVSQTQTYKITFKGAYVTPGGEPFTYEATRSISVAPVLDIATVTRTLEPNKDIYQPGDNITVTVNIRNLYNQYISFNAKDTYDPSLQRFGGITEIDNSLNRDEQKQLYLYRVLIPMNYQSDNFNLTTDVDVKGEVPLQFTTNIKVNYTKPVVVVVNETQTTAQNTTTTTQDQAQSGGAVKKIFTAIVDFFKGLFS